jgi:hypothetical protein
LGSCAIIDANECYEVYGETFELAIRLVLGARWAVAFGCKPTKRFPATSQSYGGGHVTNASDPLKWSLSNGIWSAGTHGLPGWGNIDVYSVIVVSSNSRHWTYSVGGVTRGGLFHTEEHAKDAAQKEWDAARIAAAVKATAKP